MRFIDYKCNECKTVSEYVINGADSQEQVKCSNCGSKDVLRVFAAIGIKTSSGGCDSDSCHGSSSKSCSGSSCSNCSGCG